MASFLPNIISPMQKMFINSKKVRDCIFVDFEAIDFLNIKSFYGNMALKIDISKEFDTMHWTLLLKMLSRFGFNSKFCNLIQIILPFSLLTVWLNGKQVDFLLVKIELDKEIHCQFLFSA